MNKLFFLSGLPRSGSTLLGSILSQNPEIYVTPTSPLSDILCILDDGFNRLDYQYTYDRKSISFNVYSSILKNFFNHIEKPIIIDKHRAWPRNIPSLSHFLNGEVKIIATNRRISEIISSYLILLEKDKNNFIDSKLLEKNIEISTDSRIELLWRDYVSNPYESLVFGLKNFSKNIHLVDYTDLVTSPLEELNKIYSFLELDAYEHTFDNIKNLCKEDKDSAWGIEGLHDIRPILKRISPPPEEIIGYENTLLLDNFNIKV